MWAAILARGPLPTILRSSLSAFSYMNAPIPRLGESLGPPKAGRSVIQPHLAWPRASGTAGTAPLTRRRRATRRRESTENYLANIRVKFGRGRLSASFQLFGARLGGRGRGRTKGFTPLSAPAPAREARRGDTCWRRGANSSPRRRGAAGLVPSGRRVGQGRPLTRRVRMAGLSRGVAPHATCPRRAGPSRGVSAGRAPHAGVSALISPRLSA